MQVNIGYWPMPVRLHVTRVLLGWTQAEAANKLATSLRTYQGWESGARPIPYRAWQYLVMRMGELLVAEEDRQREHCASFAGEYDGVNPIPAE